MKEFIFQGQFSSFGNIKYSTFVFTLQHQINGRGLWILGWVRQNSQILISRGILFKGGAQQKYIGINKKGFFMF